MSIALDVMGGDHAPDEVLAGAILAASELRMPLILVGQEDVIRQKLPAGCHGRIEIVQASEIVEMDETPTEALRKKKDSSIAVGTRLVKEGCAKAFVSAGNTGACTASSLLTWRQIEGIHRPAIGTPMPSLKDNFLLLDAGASPDVDPCHLVEFAVLGRTYAQRVWGRPNPSVHLLNIGEEPGKGNLFAKEAHNLLSGFSWFSGNIESKDMYRGDCDVVVCDAFVGNIVLKCAEGTAEMIVKMIKDQVPTSIPAKWLYFPLKKIMAPLRRKMDYAEVGGSPLLGLNGVCVIAHGRSNAKAIKNAILAAQKSVESGLEQHIRESVARELTK